MNFRASDLSTIEAQITESKEVLDKLTSEKHDAKIPQKKKPHKKWLFYLNLLGMNH